MNPAKSNGTQPNTLNVTTKWGILRFEKGGIRFGGTTMIFIPPHGERGCQCKDCVLYRIVSNAKENNWNIVGFDEC